MFGFEMETILLSLGYLGIFVMMTANGALSFPSSQLLYIVAGYFVSTGDLNFALAAFMGAVGNTVGTQILYELSRKHGLEFITKHSIFPEKEVRKVEAAFRHKGVWFIFIGKLLPAIKVFVPIPAGIGKMNRVLFASIMFVTSAIWAAGFLSIGYFFGKGADLFGPYALILLLVAVVVVGLFYRYINSDAILQEVENGRVAEGSSEASKKKE